MSPQMLLELVGYFASLLVLVSLLMTSVVKLRVINTVGSLIFAVYALLIHSYPTAVMNFCLVGINLFYLRRILRTEKLFTLLPARPEGEYLRHFLSFYRRDMERYFPRFDPDRADRAFFVCCDAVPAGLFLGRETAPGTLEVVLDYAAPQYRDCSVGRYLYSSLPREGIHTLTVPAASPEHGRYLRKMGFARRDGAYVKELEGTSPGK